MSTQLYFDQSAYKHRHGRQHSGAHGSEGNLVCGAVSGDGVEVGTVKVNSGQNEVGADVTLVSRGKKTNKKQEN
jgi:hypothetical protein